MTYEERQELNKLSKECFGASSRWQKIVNNGVAEPMERDREVMVPLAGGLIKKTFTDHKTVIRRYTVEETKQLMLDLLVKRKADLEKVMAEYQAKQAAAASAVTEPTPETIPTGI